MTSPESATFAPGSASSGYSVRDAIASYRRAQYLGVNANFASSASDYSSVYGDEDEDETGTIEEEYDEDDADLTPGARPSPGVGPHDYGLAWDDVETGSTRPSFRHDGPGELLPAVGTVQPILMHHEHSESTPLLRNAVSFSHDVRPDSEHVPKQRRASASSAKSARYEYTGKSTFGQTLFNSIAILLGVGMLSEPLAFAYAGWIGGTFLVVLFGALTCYTAKILGRIILSEPNLRSYADIGQRAFGPRSNTWVSTLFCLELFAISVALISLAADSLHALYPAYSANVYKIWGLLVLVPTVFMPLSLLSYTSILGIASTIFIVAVILIDGLSKREAPGSLWEPAQTALLPGHLGELGISFGLVMAGFSGHAVIPSLAKDMVDPTRFDEMINWAFGIATGVYLIVGWAGYLMFGRSVHDEISVDLQLTPGYSAALNTLALWTFVISPLSKFALVTRPVAITLEMLLGLEERAPPAAPDDHTAKPRTLSMHGHPPNAPRLNVRRAGVVAERAALTLGSVAVSVFVPEFSAMMAFIGSFAAFLLCIIGPLLAKRTIFCSLTSYDYFFVGMAVVMAAWGTGAAFWTAGSS